MTDKKKDLIRDVTKLFNALPENKKERAVGIMQGMLLTVEECKCEALTLSDIPADRLEPIKS